MPVERADLGVPGFRDYARNDEVEDPTLCGQYRDVTLRAHPCHTAHTSRHAAYTPVAAHTPVMLRAPPVMLRVVAASSNARRTLVR